MKVKTDNDDDGVAISPDFHRLFERLQIFKDGTCQHVDDFLFDAWKKFDTVSQKCLLPGNEKLWMLCALYTQLLSSDNSGATNQSLTTLIENANLAHSDFVHCMREFLNLADIQPNYKTRLLRVCNQISTSCTMLRKSIAIYQVLFNNDRKLQLPAERPAIFEFIWTMYVTVQKTSRGLVNDMTEAYYLLVSVTTTVIQALIDDNVDYALSDNFVNTVHDNRRGQLSLITAICKLLNESMEQTLNIKHYYLHVYQAKIQSNSILRLDPDKSPKLIYTNEILEKLTVAYQEAVTTRYSFDELVLLQFAKSPNGPNINSALERLRSNWQGQIDRDFDQDSIIQQLATECMKHLKPMGFEQKKKRPTKESAGIVGLNAEDAEPDLYQLVADRFLLVCPTERDFINEAVENLMLLGLSDDALLHNESSLGIAPVQPIPCKDLQNSDLLSQEDYHIMMTRGTRYSQVFASRLAENQITEARDLSMRGVALFYRLYSMLIKQEADLSSEVVSSISSDTVHRSVFVIAIELILKAAAVDNLKFPWSLRTMKLPAYHFFKIIELTIRAEPKLTRNLVTHLASLEDKCIAEFCWEKESPIYNYLGDGTFPVSYSDSVSGQPTIARGLKRKANVDNEPNAKRTYADTRMDTSAIPPTLLLFSKKMNIYLSLRCALLTTALRMPEQQRALVYTITQQALQQHCLALLRKAQHLDAILLCACVISAKIHKMTPYSMENVVNSYALIQSEEDTALNRPDFSLTNFKDFIEPKMQTFVDRYNQSSSQQRISMTLNLLSFRTVDPCMRQAEQFEGTSATEPGNVTVQPMTEARLGAKGVRLSSAGKIRTQAGAQKPAQQQQTMIFKANTITTTPRNVNNRFGVRTDPNVHRNVAMNFGQGIRSTANRISMDVFDNVGMEEETDSQYVQYLKDE